MRTANPTKPRKPYKITKPRERWNEQEHVKFLEAIDKYVLPVRVSEVDASGFALRSNAECRTFLGLDETGSKS